MAEGDPGDLPLLGEKVVAKMESLHILPNISATPAKTEAHPENDGGGQPLTREDPAGRENQQPQLPKSP